VALHKELLRTSDFLHTLLRDALKPDKENAAEIVEQFKVIEQLNVQTAEFITRVEKQELTNELTTQIETLILAQQYCLSAAEQALNVSAEIDDVVTDLHPNPLSDLQQYLRTTRTLLNSVSAAHDGEDDEALFLNKLADTRQAYEKMKSMCLRYAMSSMISIQTSMALMELIKTVRLMTEQFIKARRQLHKSSTYLES
jgi:Na+/phosphate symporter